MIKRH